MKGRKERRVRKRWRGGQDEQDNEDERKTRIETTEDRKSGEGGGRMLLQHVGRRKEPVKAEWGWWWNKVRKRRNIKDQLERRVFTPPTPPPHPRPCRPCYPPWCSFRWTPRERKTEGRRWRQSLVRREKKMTRWAGWKHDGRRLGCLILIIRYI